MLVIMLLMDPAADFLSLNNLFAGLAKFGLTLVVNKLMLSEYRQCLHVRYTACNMNFCNIHAVCSVESRLIRYHGFFWIHDGHRVGGWSRTHCTGCNSVKQVIRFVGYQYAIMMAAPSCHA